MMPSVTEYAKTDPDRWVDEYADTLFSYAFFRLQDRGTAEDLVQETFVAALGARKSFKGEASERTWLFAILKNKLIDHLRRRYREKLQSFETVPEHVHKDFFDERDEWLVKPQKWRDNPQQNFEQREFMAVLHECLKQIPENQSDAFMLREFEDVESKKICKVLDITPTNYWVLLHRARLFIRQCLEHNWF